MIIQTFPIPGNWRKEFEKAQSNSTKDMECHASDVKTGPETHVKMPSTRSGKPRFASRSDGVEAGIVSGGFVPSTLDN